MSSIKSAIKQRLCDQFIQKWFSDLDNSAREFYKVVKKKILNLNLNSFAMLFHLPLSMGSFKFDVLSLVMNTLSCFDNLIRYCSNLKSF
jgi:hypothetical protein